VRHLLPLLLLPPEPGEFSLEITSDLKVIQAKKQFVYTLKTDSRYRMIKTKIPQGDEEKGVLLFEALDSIKDDIKFLIPFSNNILFTFDVKLS